MPAQPTTERRQHPRRDASLVVTYRPEIPTVGYDITHTQNVSRGGMLLTTASGFSPGTRLSIQARLTLRNAPTLIEGIAAVIGSRELVPKLLYETRLRLVELDGQSMKIIDGFCIGDSDRCAAIPPPAWIGCFKMTATTAEPRVTTCVPSACGFSKERSTENLFHCISVPFAAILASEDSK